MGKRRSSRELALKFLYQTEFNEGDFEAQLDGFWSGVSIQDDIRIFTKDLVEQTLNHKEEIDRMLMRYSQNWTLDRMPVIDRNILRLGVGELLFSPNIPPKVVINEAVEIAKKYGNEESPDFVNGILDKIFKDLSTRQAHPTSG